ncbi:MAG: HAMP domain-containing sensor histidine kinase [Planctomycetota bacterium]
MRRRNVERQMIILVVVIGLSLTALTVWAVARQGGALRDRELADLRNSALQAAAEQTIELRGDVERALDTLAERWLNGGPDVLDEWVAGQRRWLFAVVHVVAGECATFPLSPVSPPLPPSDSDQLSLARVSELTEAVASAALARLARSAESANPVTRGRALMAMGAYQRHLASLRAAAGSYSEAATAFRSSSAGSRYAFEAELYRIDCLLALGDQAQARHALATVLDQALIAHPARYGAEQVTGLRERVTALNEHPRLGELTEQLERLERRAPARQIIPELETLLSAFRAEKDSPIPGGVYFRVLAADDVRLVVALRHISDTETVALAAPAAELVRHYWNTTVSPSWRVSLTGGLSTDTPLCELGTPFGGAVLIPTASVRERLSADARRRTAFLLATAAGTTGAWAIVIWMLLRAMARQRELVRLQQRFVADVSHELKTPLAMIRLLGETLQDGRVRDPQRVNAYYGTITREAERLSVLLDSILDFSRIESGRKQYRFEDCDVADVVRRAWALFEPQFSAEGFEASLEIAEELPRVRADAAALQQVLVNLLQNAYRYAGEGKYVRLGIRQEGYLIVVVVEDHGIGMSRAQLARLGETFFRAEDTRVRQQRGTGLGLAIVNHVVQAHGGKIEVDSQPGRGSTFTIWFPYEGATAGKE